jgi:xanthine dehydrogenase YagT iron-sulfur-binding subunit
MSEKTNESKENSEEIPNTRRTFLKKIGAVGLVASLPSFGSAKTRETITAERAEVASQPQVASAVTAVPIVLKVNGQSRQATIDPRASLLDTLRESFHQTGTKKGCDHGQCGACTVHINGKRALSCLSLALCNQGDEITTIEGLGTPEKMHPMQAAFLKHDAYQCGYCTSGQIMSAVALAKEPCGPDDADVKELMSGNICRCGAYANIVDAVQQVRKEGK